MLKKYWSHILNIIYILFIDSFIGICIIGIRNEELLSNIPTVILPIGLLIEAFLSFVVFGEMIYAIVKAAQDKELNNKALHIVLIYFFNIFYIPCFLLKHVSKEKNTTIKNIIYLTVSIIPCIVLFALVFLLSLSII